MMEDLKRWLTSGRAVFCRMIRLVILFAGVCGGGLLMASPLRVEEEKFIAAFGWK